MISYLPYSVFTYSLAGGGNECTRCLIAPWGLLVHSVNYAYCMVNPDTFDNRTDICCVRLLS